MLYALQIDTVLHNFIDNQNHYLYHPHQNQDEANLPVLPVMNNQQGATSHVNCKKKTARTANERCADSTC